MTAKYFVKTSCNKNAFDDNDTCHLVKQYRMLELILTFEARRAMKLYFYAEIIDGTEDVRDVSAFKYIPEIWNEA